MSNGALQKSKRAEPLVSACSSSTRLRGGQQIGWARLQCIHCVRPSYAHVSVKKRSVATAGSLGRALGQAGTLGSRYSERHLISVHCSSGLRREDCSACCYAPKYSLNPSVRTHTQHTQAQAHTHTSTHTRTHDHTRTYCTEHARIQVRFSLT